MHEYLASDPNLKVESVVTSLKEDGITLIRGMLKEEQADYYRSRLDHQLEERIADGVYCGNYTNQVLDNYFMTDHSLVPLVYQELTDQVMETMIDRDYVLISPSARNRRNMSRKFGKISSGFGWHTDSRYIGGEGVKPSLCYMTILCLDDFGTDNGATHFVEKSHLKYKRPDDRDMDVPFQHMIARKGDMIIFDTALWHRIGEASEKSRWGVFNTYGPWYMKPYHRFDQMFTEQEMAAFSPKIQQILHADSVTPRDHLESLVTLKRIRHLYEDEI